LGLNFWLKPSCSRILSNYDIELPRSTRQLVTMHLLSSVVGGSSGGKGGGRSSHGNSNSRNSNSRNSNSNEKSSLVNVNTNEYAQGTCACSSECWLTCFGCGCVPVYRMIKSAAPFDAVCITVTAVDAVLYSILFGLGAFSFLNFTAIFACFFICFAIGLKSHLRVKEESYVTCAKALLCGPCFMGQLAATVKAQEELVGKPVDVKGGGKGVDVESQRNVKEQAVKEEKIEEETVEERNRTATAAGYGATTTTTAAAAGAGVGVGGVLLVSGLTSSQTHVPTLPPPVNRPLHGPAPSVHRPPPPPRGGKGSRR